MNIASSYPSGPTTEQVKEVSATIVPGEDLVGNTGSLQIDTMEVKVISPIGTEYIAISAGVVQSGWEGSATGGASRVTFRLTSWPDAALCAGQRWSFQVDMDELFSD